MWTNFNCIGRYMPDETGVFVGFYGKLGSHRGANVPPWIEYVDNYIYKLYKGFALESRNFKKSYLHERTFIWRALPIRGRCPRPTVRTGQLKMFRRNLRPRRRRCRSTAPSGPLSCRANCWSPTQILPWTLRPAT